jgi:hypothetical protein
MSYARFGLHCDWYIFWRASDAAEPGEELLAIRHSSHRASSPEFSCRQIRRMLEQDDFSAIPGYTPGAAGFLRGVLGQFVRDVEGESAQRAV